ncbi:MAG: hypothetical protein Q9226_004416 [Calogaya cf. arnoldii]
MRLGIISGAKSVDCQQYRNIKDEADGRWAANNPRTALRTKLENHENTAAMADLSDFQIGQTVELQDGQTATVQFVGQTQFAAGGWIGVVLDNAGGKNDGSVQGQRYFDCPPCHGMFVRPGATKILDQPTPKANSRIQPKVNGEKPTNRQSMAPGRIRRQSMMDAASARRQSINAGSPTPSLKGHHIGGASRV